VFGKCRKNCFAGDDAPSTSIHNAAVMVWRGHAWTDQQTVVFDGGPTWVFSIFLGPDLPACGVALLDQGWFPCEFSWLAAWRAPKSIDILGSKIVPACCWTRRLWVKLTSPQTLDALICFN
jgi:hypothetical protein